MNNYVFEFVVEYYNFSLSEDVFIGGTFVIFLIIDYDWIYENIYVEYFIISGNL